LLPKINYLKFLSWPRGFNFVVPEPVYNSIVKKAINIFEFEFEFQNCGNIRDILKKTFTSNLNGLYWLLSQNIKTSELVFLFSTTFLFTPKS